MIKKLFTAGILIISFGIGTTYSQCSMYEVPLTQRIQNSTVIFEGKVLSKSSFWNSAHTLIFTSNSIEVYKNFKGNSVDSIVELITEGGIVGNNMHKVEPSLQLNEGETGIFFAEMSSVSDPNKHLGNTPLMTYASSQGFIRYNLDEQTANDPFKKYNSIETDLYKRIEKETTQKPLIVKPLNITNASNNISNLNKSIATAPSINSFSPSSITAGTGSILTINGSNFGATRGTSTVGFKNADDGGATYIFPAPAQYITWSNTVITVKVPTGTSLSGTAGTGTIQVTVGGSTGTSGSSLTITYAELNVASSNVIYQTDHVNFNNSGGYTWQMFTGFDGNAAAKAAFTRAFGTWRCGTYINWQIGSTTSINTIAQDGTNVIRFDIGSELPVGVLGRCTSYWAACSASVWYVNELDIVFDDATNWNYSTSQPTGSQSDFESVTLHELGHGHQLTHVNNSLDVMNWALTQGTSRRVLNSDDLAGGNDVMSRNIISNSCGPTHMIALTSTNCAIGAPSANFSATPTNGCSTPQSVVFTDLSTGSPTTWAWDFNNDGTTDATTQNPTYSYTTAGTYAVKLTVTNANGSNSITKTSYITIGSASLPFSEGFEGTTFPPVGWSLTQNPSDSVTWFRKTPAPGNGTSTACAYIANFHYATTGGEKDNLISKPVSLVGVNTATLTFKVAYKNFPNTSYYDTLRVYVSTNCGASYGAAVYTDGGTGLSNSLWDTLEFAPSVAGDWRTQTVSLNAFTGGSVVVKFESTNHYGNDLYIDDVNITGSTATTPVAKFIASDTTLCMGDCISFTDQSTNTPTSWAWTFTGASTSTSAIQSPTNICYPTAGTYGVSLVSTNGGGSNTKTKTGYIVVSSLPTVPIISQSGNTLTSSTATSYQWFKNGTAIPGATSISYTATASGSYTVVVTNTNSCSATSLAKVVTTTGIENIDVQGLSIYPNPATDKLTIETQQKGEFTLSIFGINGQELIKQQVKDSKIVIDISLLARGIYFVKLINDNNVIVKKIIKE